MFKFYAKLFIYLIVVTSFRPAWAGAYEDFFAAVYRDDASTVQRLLQRGFDPNSRDEGGQVPLFLALRDDSAKVAAVLIEHPQLALDASNTAGETPLMMAALKGREDWVRRLLARGAAIERDGWTPLHYAASGPSPAIVGQLLASGARVDARSPNGSTPLMMAARYGDEAAVDLLLARGADPRLRNQRELDAAGFARAGGREALAARLERLAH